MSVRVCLPACQPYINTTKILFERCRHVWSHWIIHQSATLPSKSVFIISGGDKSNYSGSFELCCFWPISLSSSQNPALSFRMIYLHVCLLQSNKNSLIALITLVSSLVFCFHHSRSGAEPSGVDWTWSVCRRAMNCAGWIACNVNLNDCWLRRTYFGLWNHDDDKSSLPACLHACLYLPPIELSLGVSQLIVRFQKHQNIY